MEETPAETTGVEETTGVVVMIEAAETTEVVVADGFTFGRR